MTNDVPGSSLAEVGEKKKVEPLDFSSDSTFSTGGGWPGAVYSVVLFSFDQKGNGSSSYPSGGASPTGAPPLPSRLPRNFTVRAVSS
jgi:hypothetical protein